MFTYTEDGQHSLRPAHPTCEEKVENPTISVQDSGLGDRVVTVQWWGEAADRDLGEQFLFHLTTPADHPMWFRHPEEFRVAFLGQIKDWPVPQATDMLAKNYSGGKDAWVFMVASGLYTNNTPDGIRCACFMGGIVLLGDPNVGVITPRRLFDSEATMEEQARAEAASRLG